MAEARRRKQKSSRVSYYKLSTLLRSIGRCEAVDGSVLKGHRLVTEDGNLQYVLESSGTSHFVRLKFTVIGPAKLSP